ncbi:MAG: hypothetical protein U0572_00850 [Phycisphaerales bacterium]
MTIALAAVALVAARASADESLLPTPIAASRLDELLARAGAGELPVGERRVVSELYARYVASYSAIRDARMERWSSEVDDLFALRTPPGEKAVRHLLAEHRALCERAADIDNSFFDDLGAAIGHEEALARVRGLRDVDRWAMTMPLGTSVGTRGDLYEMATHLDLSPETRSAVDAILAERDAALPSLVRAVWSSWRDLLLVAARSFDDTTGGVLPLIGAALSEDEANRLRDAIAERCRAEAAQCRQARQRVQALDDRTIVSLSAVLPPLEAHELALRLLDHERSGFGILEIGAESAFRAALCGFGPGHPARPAIEQAYERWWKQLGELVAEYRACRDRARDAQILAPSRLGDSFLDASGEVYDVANRFAPLASLSERELGRILAPYAAETEAAGLVLRTERVGGADGVSREAPSVSSRAWQRTVMRTMERSTGPAAERERGPSLFGGERAGVAAKMDRAWLAARIAPLAAGPDRQRYDDAIGSYATAYADRIDRPLAAIIAEAADRRRAAMNDAARRDDASILALIARRDRLFFEVEALDRELMASIAAIGPAAGEGAAARRSQIARAETERSVDRELACFSLLLLETANPWTASRDASLAPATRDALDATLAASARWFLPDLRRSRAAAFAVASPGDLRLARSEITFMHPEEEALHRARYEADRESERGFRSLLDALLEAAGPQRDAFVEAYARLASPPPSDWSPATRGLVTRIGALDLSDDRRAEMASRLASGKAERDQILLTKSEVLAGVRPGRDRSGEASRLGAEAEAIEDRVRSELLGLLHPDERQRVREGDSLDRLLDCGSLPARKE